MISLYNIDIWYNKHNKIIKLIAHIKLFDLFSCIWESETISAVSRPGYGVGAIGSKALSGGGSVWIDFTASPKSKRPN